MIDFRKVIKSTAASGIQGHFPGSGQHFLASVQEWQGLQGFLGSIIDIQAIHQLFKQDQIVLFHGLLQRLAVTFCQLVLLHDPAEEFHLPQTELEVREPGRQQAAHRQGNDLRISRSAAAAHQFHASLIELALPASLGLLIAEDTGDIGATQRKLSFLQAAAHQPGDRRGHLMAQGHHAVILADELVEMRLQIVAAAPVQGFQILYGRRHHLIIAPACKEPGQLGLDDPLLRCLSRQEISGAVWYFQYFLLFQI